MHRLLAQFGPITSPFGTLGGSASLTGSSQGSGLFAILNAFFRMAIVLAGIYVLFNLVLAGYGFMSAGGDPKAITKAWDKIWQSLLGLLVVAGSLVIAVVIGYLVFGANGAMTLISPKVYAP
jgi:hypothetical protein